MGGTGGWGQRKAARTQRGGGGEKTNERAEGKRSEKRWGGAAGGGCGLRGAEGCREGVRGGGREGAARSPQSHLQGKRNKSSGRGGGRGSARRDGGCGSWRSLEESARGGWGTLHPKLLPGGPGVWGPCTPIWDLQGGEHASLLRGGGLEWGDDDPPQSVTCRDSGFRVCAPQSGTSGDQLTPVRGCGDGAPQCLAGGCRGWSP